MRLPVALLPNDRVPLVPILLNIPVPHDGYFKFFDRYHEVSDTLWIVGTDLASDFSRFRTEIRAVDPHKIQRMIGALDLFQTIMILDQKNVSEVKPSKIITASEDVSRQVVEKYFPKVEVVWDSVFLRYDSTNVKSIVPVDYDRKSTDPFDLQMMELAANEAEESSDWWRHVGSVVVKDGQVVAFAHNQAVPSEHMPYIFGNPRDFIEAGMLSHFSDSLHSEDSVFAELLMRGGVSTLGADIYVSVFPCPRCAKLIAYSGIKRCFFGSGHASLDGEKVLRSKGVEMIYVPLRPRA